ncbi:Phosphopantetheine adenylyltransferase [Candidatus Gugararchaeum adminiculabundum]|nr:Phosphopantetheine adenylyltransferase [Candidatus Gugararchaeum adminiculabundum]
MDKNHGTAALGGTFEFLHAGHKALLSEGLNYSKLYIGITSDAFVSAHKGRKISKFTKRKSALLKFLGKNRRKCEIFSLSDRFGVAGTRKDIDALVVSAETAQAGEEINDFRKRIGMKPLEIDVVPMVYANDLKPISSDRIAAKLINSDGKRLKPLVVSVGSANKTKIAGTQRALRKIFKCKIQLKSEGVESNVRDQPFGEEAVLGAINRAKMAFRKSPGADFGIGLESGIMKVRNRFLDFSWCCVYDGDSTLGSGMGFELNQEIMEKIKYQGKELGHVVSEMAGKDVGKTLGAVHYLSNGLVKREELVEQAVISAFIPRIHLLKQ